MEKTLKITPLPHLPPAQHLLRGLSPRQEVEWLTRGRFTGEPGARAPEEGDRAGGGGRGHRKPSRLARHVYFLFAA